MKRRLGSLLVWFIILGMGQLTAQITPGVYHFDQKTADATLHHELKLNKTYFVHSVYEQAPAKFVKTLGGFYTVADKVLKVDLEFNSNHENDGITELSIPYTMSDGQLILETDAPLTFAPSEAHKQDLDGSWLFATRGPDQGQERRGEGNARKTLKFLMDGRFQWIAYHTENFKFFGTGGGSYAANNGRYTENIEYFSRDDSRVGATLEFQYELKEADWHHQGKNSKGEPLYEIWARRSAPE